MAGHTSEKRWRRNQNVNNPSEGVSDRVQNLCISMVAVLTDAQAAFAEMTELYSYVGSTIQGLADQLFYEDWSVRTTPGVKAVIEVDVVGGVVGNPVLSTAGSGYADGVGYQMGLNQTAGAGDGTAIIQYDVVAGAFANVTVVNGGATYTNGLGQVVQETPLAGEVFDTQANAEEVSKTQDAFDAITALNDLHQCANNEIVAQEDRYSQLRRMS